MAEPTNTKRRKVLVEDNRGKLDMHQRKQGELPPHSEDKKSKSQEYCGTDMEAGTEEMDLDKVDNENRETIHPMKYGPDREDTFKNIDFGKLHDDMRLTVVSKKKSGAGQ